MNTSSNTTTTTKSRQAHGRMTLVRWLIGVMMAIVLPSVLSVASAQSLSVAFVLNNASGGSTVNWRTGDTGNAVISYSCGSGPCNGVVFTYQAAAPISVWGVQGGVGVTTTPAAVTASRVASYAIDNVTNRVTVTMNSLPSGTGSVTLNNIRSYGGSTPGQSVTHTLTTTSSNAGVVNATINVSVVTPQPTGTVVAAIASPNDVAIGETVNYTASLALTPPRTNGTNSRAVIGPATITYTAPSGSNVINAPSICYSPLGAEFARTTAGFVTWPATSLPAATPTIAGNVVTWNIPTGNMLRLCGVDGDGQLGTNNLLIRVQFPAANFLLDQLISSQLCIEGFYPGGIATDTPCGSITGNVRARFLSTRIKKGRLVSSVAPQFPTVGDLDVVPLTLDNSPLPTVPSTQAAVTLKTWTIRDAVPPAVKVNRVVLNTFTPTPAPTVVARWRYRLQSTPPGNWVTASTTGLTLDFCTLVPAVCTPTPTEWVTEWEFTWDSTVGSNQPIPPNQNVIMYMYYQLQAMDRDGNQVSAGQPFTNTATSDATADAGTMIQATAQESFFIPSPNGGRWSTHGTSTASAGQSVTAISATGGVGSTASCSVDAVDNSIRGGAIGPMVDPVLLLTMPGDYAGYAVALSTQTVSGVPEPTRVVCSDVAGQDFTVAAPLVSMVTDYRGSGRVATIARWPGVSIPRGCRIGDTSLPRLLTLSATLASQTLAGPNANGCLATIFSDQPGLSGHNASSASGPWELGGAFGNPVNVGTVVLTDTFDQNGDGSTADGLRAANATLTVPSIPAIAGSKNWFNASVSPITAAERGQTLLTVIRLRNTGNDTLTDFTIVDVLPAAGDLNFSLASRGSTTNARLTGAITGLPTGVIASYSTSSNPCRSSIAGSNPNGTLNLPAGCSAPNWQAAGAIADWTTVRAIRLVGSGLTLLPYNAVTLGPELVLNFPLRIDANAAVGTQVVNDAAVNVTLAVGGNTLQPFSVDASPLPIVSTFVGGRVFNDLDSSGTVNGSEAGLGNFVVSITCTSGPNCAIGEVFSTVTNATGNYSFTTGASNVFANGTATGVAIPSFPGLISGTWKIAITPPISPSWTNVTRAVGIVNGIATGIGAGRAISAVLLPVGGTGINYNFGEVLTPGQITVTKNILLPTGVSGPFGLQFSAVCNLPAAGTVFGPVSMNYPTTNTVVIPNIPAGATCTVNEQLPSPPAGYAWGAPSIGALSPSGGMPAAGNQTVNVANTLQSGGLTVQKTVSTPLPTAATFNFTLTCSAPSTTPATTALGASVSTAQSISIAAGGTFGSVTVSPIAAGSTCAVSETAPADIPNFTWGATPAAVTGIAIVRTPTARASFLNTLTANPGKITVTKAMVLPSGVAGPFSFGFAATCDRPTAGSTFNATLNNYPTNTSVDIPNIPAGATCSLSETLSAAPSGFAWGPVSFSNLNPAVMATAGTQTVTATNTLASGSLTVSKAISGATQGVAAGANVSVTVTCTGAGGATLPGFGSPQSLTIGSSLNFPNIVPGSTCSVTEDLTSRPSLLGPQYQWQAPVISAPVTIANGVARTLSITNPIQLLTGGLNVTKTVTGETAGYLGSSNFSLTVDCKINNASLTGFPDTQIYTNGQTRNYPNVPNSAICSLTEGILPNTSAPQFAYQVPVISGPVTISTGTTAELTAQNPIALVTGSLTVNKIVLGQTAGYVTGSTFPITTDCQIGGVSQAGFPDTQNLANGQSHQYPSVPVTAVCISTEGTRPATSGPQYAYDTPVISDLVTIAMGTEAHITVQNPVRLLTGSVTVSKQISGAGAGYVTGTTFPIGLTCTDPSNTIITPPTADIAAGANAVFANLPNQSLCSATEGTRPATTGIAYAWGAPQISPAVNVATNATQAITITNPLQLVVGGMTFNKQISGAPSGYTPVTGFAVNALCAIGSTTTRYPTSGNFTVIAGTPLTISSITAGSSCIIQEDTTNLPPPPANYRWKVTTPPFINQPASINVGANVPATITNTLEPLDPPFITKSGRLLDASTVEWKIVVANNRATNANSAPINITVTDPLPSGMTFVGGSVACTPHGAGSVALTCALNGGNTALSVTGSLPYDANNTDAGHNLTIVFKGQVLNPGSTITNLASAIIDSAPNNPVSAQASVGTEVTAVPVGGRWMLSLLALMLLGIGSIVQRQTTARSNGFGAN